jgi:lipoprotein-releasing system ATP-binding protein
VEVPVLLGVDLDVAAGSASRSSALRAPARARCCTCLGGLDEATSGTVLVQGRNLNSQSESERGRMRNRALGFVYQFHHLLPEFSAQENVAMPLLIRRVAREEAAQAAAEVLTQVGLGHRLVHRPGELSGGERQRAALARALVTRPTCVLADEPTGNLDRQNAEIVFDLMLDLNRRSGASLVVVTHDMQIASRADRVLRLVDGVLGKV